MKSFLVYDKNLGNDELQLLKSFISQHSQTPILFWGRNPSFISTSSALYQSFEKLGSLKYLCINSSYLDENWPNFFNQFKRLKLVYFTPNELHYTERTWIINTPKTVFIMAFVKIEQVSSTLE
jgi:hypothetical protein